MIEVYVDESGVHKGSKLVVAAAYSGPTEEWQLFTDQWRQVLNRANVRYFHATEKHCDRLRPALLECLRPRRVKGLAVAVNPGTYDAVASDDLRNQFGNAYAFCALNAVIRILQGVTDEVAMTIEGGQPNVDYLHRLFQSELGKNLNIKTVTVATKMGAEPLHAADFLAHCIGARDEAYVTPLLKPEIGKAQVLEFTGDHLVRMNEMVKGWSSKRKQKKHSQRHSRKTADKVIDHLTKDGFSFDVVDLPMHLKTKYPYGSVSWGVFLAGNGRQVVIPMNEEGYQFVKWFGANVDSNGQRVVKFSGRRKSRRERRKGQRR